MLKRAQVSDRSCGRGAQPAPAAGFAAHAVTRWCRGECVTIGWNGEVGLHAGGSRLTGLHHDRLRRGGRIAGSAVDVLFCWRKMPGPAARTARVPQALLIAALGFAFATATERGNDMVLTMLRRGWPAIRNLGTLELIT